MKGKLSSKPNLKCIENVLVMFSLAKNSSYSDRGDLALVVCPLEGLEPFGCQSHIVIVQNTISILVIQLAYFGLTLIKNDCLL